jgi:hypothetical protein
MEALGVASGSSGIAGILSLAGQLIATSITFYGFFKDVANAPRTVHAFFQDLNFLIRTLEAVRDICGQINAAQASTDNYTALSIDSLRFQLEEYSKDLDQWIEMAKKSNIGTSDILQMFCKKVAIASKMGNIASVRERIQTHSQFISSTLSVLGR